MATERQVTEALPTDAGRGLKVGSGRGGVGRRGKDTGALRAGTCRKGAESPIGSDERRTVFVEPDLSVVRAAARGLRLPGLSDGRRVE